MRQEAAALDAVLVYRHCHLREFPLYLERFVPEVGCGPIRSHLLEPFCLAPVPP